MRRDLDPALKARLREEALAITQETAATLLPTNYTGWIAAEPASYDAIEAAGGVLGRLRNS